jgi:hypothetical protein
MTARIDDNGLILLEGECAIDDAGTLLELLLAKPEAEVDWSGCDRAHTAVVQVLLALRPRLIGRPKDPFLSNFIAVLVEEAA